MPVYFMRVSDGSSLIQISDGEYHPDDASVIQAAEQLARTAIKQGEEFQGQRIEISDAEGRQVATVEVGVHSPEDPIESAILAGFRKPSDGRG